MLFGASVEEVLLILSLYSGLAVFSIKIDVPARPSSRRARDVLRKTKVNARANLLTCSRAHPISNVQSYFKNAYALLKLLDYEQITVTTSSSIISTRRSYSTNKVVVNYTS